jgi:tripartite-type tricarboxylate transporter receptor subunit TctC
VWWAGQVAAGTPKPIVDRLNAWFLEVLRMEETEKFLANIGTDVFQTTPEETRRLIQNDIKMWGDYVRTAKIDPS